MTWDELRKAAERAHEHRKYNVAWKYMRGNKNDAVYSESGLRRLSTELKSRNAKRIDRILAEAAGYLGQQASEKLDLVQLANEVRDPKEQLDVATVGQLAGLTDTQRDQIRTYLMAKDCGKTTALPGSSVW